MQYSEQFEKFTTPHPGQKASHEWYQRLRRGDEEEGGLKRPACLVVYPPGSSYYVWLYAPMYTYAYIWNNLDAEMSNDKKPTTFSPLFRLVITSISPREGEQTPRAHDPHTPLTLIQI